MKCELCFLRKSLLLRKSSQPVEGLVSCLEEDTERRLFLRTGLGASIFIKLLGLLILGKVGLGSSPAFMLKPTSVKEKIRFEKVASGDRIGALSISSMYQLLQGISLNMNTSDLKRTRELPFSESQSFKRLKMSNRFKAALFTNPASLESRIIRTLPPSTQTNHHPKKQSKPTLNTQSTHPTDITKAVLINITQTHDETELLAQEITQITAYIEELETRLEDQNGQLTTLINQQISLEAEQHNQLKEYSDELLTLEQSLQLNTKDYEIEQNKISVLQEITTSLQNTIQNSYSSITHSQYHNNQLQEDISQLMSEYEHLTNYYTSELHNTKFLIQDVFEISDKNEKDEEKMASLIRCIQEYRK